MPELPEVETLVKQLQPILQKNMITSAQFFRSDLREKIPIKKFPAYVLNKPIQQVSRRSKYLIIHTTSSRVLVHLGMSGALLCYDLPTIKHDHTHAVFKIQGKQQKIPVYLHYVDPRRFGLIDICTHDLLEQHPRIKHLGVEPLATKDLGSYLRQQSQSRSVAIKSFLMNAKIVVGVGNIYACESLFKAGIHPKRLANRISHERYLKLGKAIQNTLKKAIKAGGTTLNDYRNIEGKPGYFKVELAVYGRQDEPCYQCSTNIKSIKQTGRSSWFCSSCQT